VQLHQEFKAKNTSLYNKIALKCFADDLPFLVVYHRSQFLQSYLYLLELYLLHNDYLKMSQEFQDKNKHYKNFACFFKSSILILDTIIRAFAKYNQIVNLTKIASKLEYGQI
jgi:hypothetical protein